VLRCCSIRILPHKQNSGGFFVAVLHKKYLLRDVQSTPKSSHRTVHEPVSEERTTATSEPVMRLSSGTVCEPVSDEGAAATKEPSVRQNDTAVLDHTSGAQDCATIQDSGASQQTASDNLAHSGWFNANG